MHFTAGVRGVFWNLRRCLVVKLSDVLDIHIWLNACTVVQGAGGAKIFTDRPAFYLTLKGLILECDR